MTDGERPTLGAFLRATWMWWAPPLVVVGGLTFVVVLALAGVVDFPWAYALW